MPVDRSARAQAELFVQRVESLAGRRSVVENTVRAHLSLKFDEVSSTMQTDFSDLEGLRSLLMDFRPFVSKIEDVFANKIFNLLERVLSDTDLRDAARENRQQWKAVMSGPMSLIVNDKTYRADDCLDLILNGDRFHMDANKASEFSLLPLFIQRLMTQQVISATISGLQVLWPTRNIIRKALDEGLLFQRPQT